MKKAVYFLSIAVFSALFTLSCQSLSVSIEEATQPEGRTFTCVFAQPDPDTKINVDLSNGKTTWKVGDKILINAGSGGTSRRTVTLTAGDIFDEGKKAIITIPSDLKPYDRKADRGIESTYYAMYPADNVASGSLYYNQAFSNQNDFLMAACNVGDTFVFYNLCGVIAYTVNDGEDDYNFDQVVFAGKNGETVAYDTYQARVRDDGSGAYVAYTQNADSYNPLVPRTSCTNTVVSDGSTVNYIFLPGGANLTGGFTFSFLSGGVIKKTASVKTGKNVPHGSILELGDISTHLKNYVPPTKHDNTIEVNVATAIDLSASETANCYMLPADVPSYAGASFKFKAAKGKGGDVLTSIGGDEDKDVVVLWETQNDATAPDKNSIITAVDYDMQSGADAYIVFKMPSPLKPGNAVIAAKNAGGDILWSWHIWVPRSSVDDVDGSKLCGSTLMDRNLGALDAVSTSDGASVYSLGMFYQWGRKDPFLSPSAMNKDAGRAAVTGVAPSVKSAAMTISESLANPTQYAAVGISDMDLTKWSQSKTQYDPCPPGYRLPYMKRGDKPMSNTSNIVTALTGDNTWEANTTKYWVKISDGSHDLVFPLAGYVEEGIASYYSYKNTLRGAIWFLCDSGSGPYHLNFRPSESSNAFGSTQLHRGCNVRCCVE